MYQKIVTETNNFTNYKFRYTFTHRNEIKLYAS